MQNSISSALSTAADIPSMVEPFRFSISARGHVSAKATGLAQKVG